MALKAKDVPLLKDKLDALARTYHDAYLATDPLEIAHAYQGERNREVAAFLSASLAFGNAAAIRESVKRIMDRLGPEPAGALRRYGPEKNARLFEGLYHRWVGPEAIGLLTQAIGAALRSEGSLEALFLKGYRAEEETLQGALKRFRDRLLRSLPASPANPKIERGIHYLLPDPESGSACKRFHLFLRWMVRPADGLDLGLWKGPKTHQLIIPLDTHIARIGRLLGLTDRKTPDLKMALEITAKPETHRPGRPGALRFRHLADGYSQALSEQAKLGALRRLPSSGRLPLLAASSPKKKRRREGGARMNGGVGCRSADPGIPCHPD